jgi:hypothetical protein
MPRAIFALRAVAANATRALKVIAALATVKLLFATLIIAATPSELGKFWIVYPILPAAPVRMEAIAIRLKTKNQRKRGEMEMETKCCIIIGNPLLHEITPRTLFTFELYQTNW